MPDHKSQQDNTQESNTSTLHQTEHNKMPHTRIRTGDTGPVFEQRVIRASRQRLLHTLQLATLG
jgi:hypothetical protein